MYSPSMELLVNKIDHFNEKYAIVENEKAVFSIEYAEFHWDTVASAGCFEGNRYGLVRMARDLMLIAAASESGKNNSDIDCATHFEDGSDDIIILKKRPTHESADRIQIDWNETRGFHHCNETSYLENILESMNGVIESFDGEETEPAQIKWDEYNKAAFLTGTASGLLLLAREFVQFALSATSGDKYEVRGLQQDSGRLILVLKEID